MAPRLTNRARPPAAVAAAAIQTVRIGDPDDPTTVRTIRLRWRCPLPACRHPRGDLWTERHAHHDAAGRFICWTRVHRWRPPCGHVQLNAELLAEAAALADALAAGVVVPAPRAGQARGR